MDPTAPPAAMVVEDETKKFRRVKLLSLMASFAKRENEKRAIPKFYPIATMNQCPRWRSFLNNAALN
jgi:hypothetical protein